MNEIAPDCRADLNPSAQKCLQGLLQVWFNFERRLNKVPIIQRLEQNRFSLQDYQNLLLNLRQQVIEGSRWISRAASSFDRNFADVRSMIIGHAADEHRDYEILEKDYVATGGELASIQSRERNAGSEALHAFLMYRASHPNPVDMLGAMWIIEGLGQKMASEWARQITSSIKTEHNITQFMQYHGNNDDAHMNTFYKMLDRVCQQEQQADSIVKTAIVTGKLYVLQLEEVDND